MNYEPTTAGNQTNDNACIETNVNAGQTGQEKASDHEYILLQLMLSNSLLSSSSQSIDNKDADEVPGKGDDDLSERNGQEKEEGDSNKEDDQHVQDFRAEFDNLLVQQKEGFDNVDGQERIDSSTQDVNTVGLSINTASENINTGSSNINIASPIPNDPSIQSLEATSIFDDAYDDRAEVGAEANLNNLKDERGIVVRNKARLITQGYTQEEGINYDEVFAPFARIEAIRLFLAYASFMGLIVYRMDVKSAFLYGTIKDEVYVFQPLGFEDPQFPDKMMHKRFQMSYMGELTLFLGLKVQHKEDGIFISQDKYVADILKKFDFTTVKAANTPIETNKALNKDEEA
ncbi:putative ribonuclease H-like domain-containing protein [Tanacetum coccineum]